MNKKALTILGIVTLLIAVVAGGFWYVQKYVQDDNHEVVNNEREWNTYTRGEGYEEFKYPKDWVYKEKGHKEIDTSSWKTYENEQFGFEVKYPEDWIYQKSYYEYSGLTQVVFVMAKGCKDEYRNDLLQCDEPVPLVRVSYVSESDIKESEKDRFLDFGYTCLDDISPLKFDFDIKHIKSCHSLVMDATEFLTYRFKKNSSYHTFSIMTGADDFFKKGSMFDDIDLSVQKTILESFQFTKN